MFSNVLLLNVFCFVFKFLIEKFNFKFILLLGLLYGFINYNNFLLIGTILSLFYWSLGAFFALKQIDLNKIKMLVDKYNIIYLYILGIIICFIISYYQIPNAFIIDKIVTIVGCITLIALTYKLKDSKLKNILLKLSQYTFPIFLMHEFNLFFFRKLLSAVLPNTITFISLEYALCPILIIIYCIVISDIIKKLLPNVYTIMFGKR